MRVHPVLLKIMKKHMQKENCQDKMKENPVKGQKYTQRQVKIKLWKEATQKKQIMKKKEDDSSDHSQSKCSLQKHLKCDMSYLPGNPFHYRFINTALNENKKKVLQTKMQHRLLEIRKKYYRLTGRKRIRMVGRKKKYPSLPVAALSMD